MDSAKPFDGADARPAGRPFRFYDNREKYLLFVTTCSEKWVVGERVGLELARIEPKPPALSAFDAGMGDATVLARVMRHLHHRFPSVPLRVVAKEISLEDVRLGLEKMPDRFIEHPETVLVITNMRYGEVAALAPQGGVAAVNWQDVPLRGGSALEFDEQIKALQPLIAEGWRTRLSEASGNPVYVMPTVLVLYRHDRRFMLDATIPRPGGPALAFDLIVASQPFQARTPARDKARRVLAPLARALAPQGRMIVIQSTGRDPGMEIIHALWPGEYPFRTPRGDLIEALREGLGASAAEFLFDAYPDHRSEFRFSLHTLPSEIGTSIGTSTLLAAWNAAVYVAQIDDARLSEALRDDRYLQATWKVLKKHGGLWFVDESFAVERRRS